MAEPPTSEVKSLFMNLMEDASRLAADPVGNEDQQKEDLIRQILDLQNRYRFKGQKHSPEALADKTMRWLEKMCDHQLLAITLCHVPDRTMHTSGATSAEALRSEVARERAYEANLLRRGCSYDRGEVSTGR